MLEDLGFLFWECACGEHQILRPWYMFLKKSGGAEWSYLSGSLPAVFSESLCVKGIHYSWFFSSFSVRNCLHDLELQANRFGSPVRQNSPQGRRKGVSFPLSKMENKPLTTTGITVLKIGKNPTLSDRNPQTKLITLMKQILHSSSIKIFHLVSNLCWIAFCFRLRLSSKENINLGWKMKRKLK